MVIILKIRTLLNKPIVCSWQLKDGEIKTYCHKKIPKIPIYFCQNRYLKNALSSVTYFWSKFSKKGTKMQSKSSQLKNHVSTKGSFESVIEVFNDILDVLETNGHSDQVIRDSQCYALVLLDWGVCHAIWELGQRLVATQRLRQCDELERLQEGVVLFEATLVVKGQHAGVAVLLLLDELVLRVRFQKQVLHPCDAGVGLQVLGNLLSDLHVSHHSHLEGLETAIDQVAVEGAWDSACKAKKSFSIMRNGQFPELQHSNLLAKKNSWKSCTEVACLSGPCRNSADFCLSLQFVFAGIARSIHLFRLHCRFSFALADRSQQTMQYELRKYENTYISLKKVRRKKCRLRSRLLCSSAYCIT